MRETATTLAEVVERMEALGNLPGDRETPHGEADDLLLDAVLLLAGDDGERIERAYRAVKKWYG